MSKVDKLTLVTGGTGGGTAGGDVARSGLKDEAIIGEVFIEGKRNFWCRLVKLAPLALASVDTTGNLDGRRRGSCRKIEREREGSWRSKFLKLINEEMAAFISRSNDDVSMISSTKFRYHVVLRWNRWIICP